jgi:F-type H+-transporting ATPase subunit gamma
MEMVAASKMRKAQERMRMARPYADKIRSVIGHLYYAHPEYRHPFMVERAPKRAGLIIISTDRGLCGGLNTNAFKASLGWMREWRGRNVEFEVCSIGLKGFNFMKRLGANIASSTSHLGDHPGVEQVIGVVKTMLDAYRDNRLDRVDLLYNRFVNTMSQQPVIEQLLPLPSAPDEDRLKHHWDYIYEPDAPEVIDQLLVRYIETQVYRGVVENYASEQSARMVAMKAASDNAGKLIDELNLKYNKARQAAITRELAEIVGGAAAV